MATIGGVSCDFITGRFAGLKETSVIRRQRGSDGYLIQKLGKGDSSFAVQLIKFADADDVDTWITSIEALQGSSASISVVYTQAEWYNNPAGKTYGNLFVKMVSPPERFAGWDGALKDFCRINASGVITE